MLYNYTIVVQISHYIPMFQSPPTSCNTYVRQSELHHQPVVCHSWASCPRGSSSSYTRRNPNREYDPPGIQNTLWLFKYGKSLWIFKYPPVYSKYGNTLWLFESLPWKITIEIVSFPMKNGDFPQLCGCLPEGMSTNGLMNTVLLLFCFYSWSKMFHQ